MILDFRGNPVNHVVVSKQNSKMGKVASVSLTPIKACPADVPCAKSCYAKKSYIAPVHKPVRLAWDGNLAYVQQNPDGYRKEIDAYLRKPRKNPLYFFRWHVGGDILGQWYLDDIMVPIADNNPTVHFLAFTKNHNLNFSRFPRNLVIVASMWTGWGNPDVPLRKAWLLDHKNPDPRIPANAMICQGGCDSCGLCWNLPEIGRDVVFHKH
jgi:hypothetical protein